MESHEESRPLYEEAVVPIKVDGQTYCQKVLHFNTTVLPLVLAGLTTPEEWQLAEFAGGCCMLIGPLFAMAVDATWQGVSDSFRRTPKRP